MVHISKVLLKIINLKASERCINQMDKYITKEILVVINLMEKGFYTIAMLNKRLLLIIKILTTVTTIGLDIKVIFQIV